jgi:hypothetical protein
VLVQGRRRERREEEKRRVGWAKELGQIRNLGCMREEVASGLREENHGPEEGFRLNSKVIVLFF